MASGVGACMQCDGSFVIYTFSSCFCFFLLLAMDRVERWKKRGNDLFLIVSAELLLDFS